MLKLFAVEKFPHNKQSAHSKVSLSSHRATISSVLRNHVTISTELRNHVTIASVLKLFLLALLYSAPGAIADFVSIEGFHDEMVANWSLPYQRNNDFYLLPFARRE